MTRPAWSWRHGILKSQLPSTTRHVLLTISCSMNDLGEGCYRTTKEIARFSGLSERAVCTHIENAVQAGWLKKSRHGFRGQRWKRHEYEPCWPVQGAEQTSAPVPETLNVCLEGTEPGATIALNEVQRDKDLSESLSPSLSIQALGDGSDFERLWTAWPEAERPREKKFTQRIFLALAPVDQALAIEHVAKHRVVQAQRCSPPRMIPYLRNREFIEFDGAPALTFDGLFDVRPGSAEWQAWEAYLKPQLSSETWAKQEARGYLVCSKRWPEPAESDALLHSAKGVQSPAAVG